MVWRLGRGWGDWRDVGKRRIKVRADQGFFEVVGVEGCGFLEVVGGVVGRLGWVSNLLDGDDDSAVWEAGEEETSTKRVLPLAIRTANPIVIINLVQS